MNRNRFVLIWLLLFSVGMFAQEIQHPRVHSHNDYDQSVPFWNAYSSGANSIEADVFLKHGVLYVTHSESEIIQERTLEELYLKPLLEIYGMSKDAQAVQENQNLQILIDVKSEAIPSLEALINLLRAYDGLTKNSQLRFVISGNRPKPEQYSTYPDFIWFDHQDLEPISDQAWGKVALISMSFGRFSNWNGTGSISTSDLTEIERVIKIAHGYDKPFRFWGTPDSRLAWETFSTLGVDFINTDLPSQCVEFVSGFYKLGLKSAK